MDKKEILSNLILGNRVAEEEKNSLGSYFVETIMWKRVFNGDIDIVYGPKGAGKSAIYSLLIERKNDLMLKNIYVISAENPRGATVFEELKSETTEIDFRNLWKLYIMALIMDNLIHIENSKVKKIRKKLIEAKIIRPTKVSSLSSTLNNALGYLKSLITAKSYESEVKFDPVTGLFAGISGKITLREPSDTQKKEGYFSIDNLYEMLKLSLDELDIKIWIAIDRLDVAFSESPNLEQNALKALFRVYSDFGKYDKITLKVFLRNDIWNNLVDSGFREATHTTRSISITWDKRSLMNIIISRLLNNIQIIEYYNVDKSEILSDIDKQFELFYRIFPIKVENGEKQSLTFDWILSHTSDATGFNAPREIIHLLTEAIDNQVRNLDIGTRLPEDLFLFERKVIKDSLLSVSKERLVKTLYAEYPTSIANIEKLRGKKIEQTISSLAQIWSIDERKVIDEAQILVKIGFFKSNTGQKNSYKVPYIYSQGLNMVQGKEK
ncbi:hypothetical protein EHS13_22975 [Paenibacillus psychroresistens]|uniref:Uncharacterized protein n=1 Tax=Paenibacillus psychroresistens TaxID=1778678 RepID=A0A6B8RQ80_9BACL|nr:hypothetical protein [Paenibacillus psychroresistens]QGQ97546.1 hypothetical protein EHS13_22975 [Paenibacillus psychroresistens]